MIIDFHTHAFPDSLADKALALLLANIESAFTPVTDGTVKGLLQHMAKTGVNLSVLQPVVTKPSQFRSLNEWAAAAACDKIVPFGGVHPLTDDYKRDIDYVVSLGLKGLKFHCEYQDFVVDDPKMLPIYDYALSRDLILLHHAGFDPGFPPPFKSTPQRFAAVVDAMKGGVIVAAHLGGHGQWYDVLHHLAGKNIYLDTAMGFEYFSNELFLQIVAAHGADKVLFASDSPWSDAGSELESLEALPLCRAEKDLIRGGNAARLLGF
ncbi:amidohydrolase family protein [Oscillospiraceae bacterium WX1]